MKKVLLDANVLLRFFEGEHADQYAEAAETMRDIQEGRIDAVLLDMIVAEIVYVLRRIYGRTRTEIAYVLREIITLPHIHVENRAVLFATFELYADRSIDFADAMLCAKKQLEGYAIVSFDKKVRQC